MRNLEDRARGMRITKCYALPISDALISRPLALWGKARAVRHCGPPGPLCVGRVGGEGLGPACNPRLLLDRKSPPPPPPTPCPDTGLSKHGHPVFPHFWVFFATSVFAVPIHSFLLVFRTLFFFSPCRTALVVGQLFVPEYGADCQTAPCWFSVQERPASACAPGGVGRGGGPM